MEDLYLGYLEDKHYRKVRKSDKPVVFTGRKGAIWGIVLTLVLAAVIAWCFTAPFEPEGAWLRWPLGILFFHGGALVSVLFICQSECPCHPDKGIHFHYRTGA